MNRRRSIDDVSCGRCHSSAPPLIQRGIQPTITKRLRLFCDTVAGANASANLYSLVETAKAGGVDAHQYLVALLKALPLAQTADDYEALLPWNLAPAQP